MLENASDEIEQRLSPEAQALLVCLAPFTAVVGTRWLEMYTAHLRRQPALAHLPYPCWAEVLKEATDEGLLAAHPQVEGFIQMQPALGDFLRRRVQTQPEQLAAVQAAWSAYYDELGGMLVEQFQSSDMKQQRAGQTLAKLEYENLSTALDMALTAHDSIVNLYWALYLYLGKTLARRDEQRRLELGSSVLARLEAYPPEALRGRLGAELVGVIDNIASCQLSFKQYAAAQASYEKALSLLLGNQACEPGAAKKASASIYRQLGIVAQAQQQWAQAEGHYRQALQLYIEFNDGLMQAVICQRLGLVMEMLQQLEQAESDYRQSLQLLIELGDRDAQAETYHNLGVVLQKQQKWAQAESCYQQALQLLIESNRRHAQAGTYYQLGTLAQEQRQWAQAESYYRQALQLFIKYSDRYEQASVCYRLGLVMQAQQQWAPARTYLVQALEILAAHKKDEHSLDFILGKLAQVWQAGGEAELPAAVAAVLGVSPQEVEQTLRQALEGDES